MQKILIIINDAPYGTEKAYNALRMAMTMQKEHGEKVSLIYDHHKDFFTLIKIIGTDISRKKKLIYILTLCLYFISFISFVVNLLNKIANNQ